MTQIELRGVQKYFGAVQVIKDLNLKIDDNEFIVLLGQSGCGKTTTLRAIAGLETIDGGDILIDGKPVQHLKAADRDIAMVFQSFSLYPHMSVYENVAFPLRATRKSRAEIDSEVRSVAKTLQITDLLEKKPSALSGGDMQRVAIGRALVRRPKAMLMDEPIGALDAKLREEMRAEIKRLHIKQGSTSIYVTHDQIEAMSLADRIVIMHEGVLQQVGSPDEVYSHPANLFVAQFVGSPVMNVAEASVTEKAASASVTVGGAAAGFEFPRALLSKLNGHASGQLALGIRPEGVIVRREAAEGFLPVETKIVEPLGSFDIVDLMVGSKMLRARTKSGFVSGPGEKVFARIDPAQAHFFDTASGRSLGVRL
ncbi:MULTISPECIES: ABC transporter ATP-binding protein [unclassified Mesorhizobium]|uniref:ABC transporter ATP-binding protein n=1 Tax=unclassified Mesorhizobium TaxID=325217 RepID=UPI000FD75AB8|nr:MULTISPECIES: ABC transporter ATP-binding protein [unclassified Mesorhizobium]TGQ45964.1 ABC transporter ATP-binding protein [Mesorhizobium sp. M00.F.Ca.ET.216.01.1.1]TIS59483.1 MAG: ATP-binding cassette domain-containing protein [Mesorhizobium sp.]TIS91129.1 MAG: ATP-binding cassette domain-containing protein [Mesorhizobium sp.]